MHKRGKLSWLSLVVLFLMAPVPSLQAQGEDGEKEKPILVGHISHIEGTLFRYDPEEKDWVATVKDAPFGEDDIVYSDKYGRAELLMPNNTWVRIGGDTQIELTALNDEGTGIDVTSGTARFYNKSSHAVVKATTFYGSIVAPARTSFDVYVDDHSVEVIALKGTVDFFHRTTGTKYEVIAGSSSLSADSRHVRAAEGVGDYSWNTWNRDRDSLWARREREQRESAEYLPPGLYDEGYVLDETGRWESVYYDGAYRSFWRPAYVAVGWSPFTVGRWVTWYGHPTWIPHESFGYLTHHYGNWVFVGSAWYWAPPVSWHRLHGGYSPLRIGFGWYPGRVSWIHHRHYIGWVPLAPFEPYYCYRRWGPHTVVVKNINITNITTNRNQYRYFNHAVIINRNNLYNVDNYQKVRVWDAPSSLQHYRVAPGMDTTKVRVDTASKERYNFSTTSNTRNQAHVVTDTPHQNRPGASERIKGSTGKNQYYSSIPMERSRFLEKSGRAILPGSNGKVPEDHGATALSERKSEKPELKTVGKDTIGTNPERLSERKFEKPELKGISQRQHLETSPARGKTWPNDGQYEQWQSSERQEAGSSRSSYKRESLTVRKGGATHLRSGSGTSLSRFGSGENSLSHSGRSSSKGIVGYSGMQPSKGNFGYSRTQPSKGSFGYSGYSGMQPSKGSFGYSPRYSPQGNR